MGRTRSDGVRYRQNKRYIKNGTVKSPASASTANRRPRSGGLPSLHRPAPAAYSGFAGELNALPAMENVGKLLECPICLEVPLPPIFTCAKGHNICGGCKDKVYQCGLCNANYGTARNFTAEALVSGSTFKCSHDGCEEVVRGDQMVEHLNVCKQPLESAAAISASAKLKAEAVNAGPARALHVQPAPAAVAQHQIPITPKIGSATLSKKTSSASKSQKADVPNKDSRCELLRKRLVDRLRQRKVLKPKILRSRIPSPARSRKPGRRRSSRLRLKKEKLLAEGRGRSSNPSSESKSKSKSASRSRSQSRSDSESKSCSPSPRRSKRSQRRSRSRRRYRGRSPSSSSSESESGSRLPSHSPSPSAD